MHCLLIGTRCCTLKVQFRDHNFGLCGFQSDRARKMRPPSVPFNCLVNLRFPNVCIQGCEPREYNSAKTPQFPTDTRAPRLSSDCRPELFSIDPQILSCLFIPIFQNNSASALEKHHLGS